MKIKSLFHAIVVPGLFGCCGCSSPSATGLHFPESFDLQGKYWNVHDSLGRPFDIKATAGYVVLRDDWTATKLTLLDRKEGHPVRHFGRSGGGPGELTNPGPLWAEGNRIEVFDGSRMSLLRFNADSVRAEQGQVGHPVFQTAAHGIISLAHFSDTAYVATGVFPEGRFCLLDNQGHVTGYREWYPSATDVSGNLPFHVLGLAYQSNLCTQPGGNRTAVVTRYGSMLQIHAWNPTSGEADEVACVQEFSPGVNVRNVEGTPNFAPGADTRWGYLSVDASARYIYALYSGKLQKDGTAFNLGNEVRVFDWDGRPVCLLRLNAEGSALSVCGDRLFLLSESVETGRNDVVEYVLPES